MTTDTQCQHHYLIDTAGLGVCKKCGATRNFAVCYEEVARNWNNAKQGFKRGRPRKEEAQRCGPTTRTRT